MSAAAEKARRAVALGKRAVAAATASVLLATGGGCARAQAAAAGPAVRTDSSLAADTALLVAVLSALPRQPYHRMEFDPRVIKDDPNAVFIHPPRDFSVAGGPVVEARAAVIQRVNATRHVADDYFACSHGPGGLGRADSAGVAMRAGGPERPYCVVAGVPRRGGPYFPAGSIDQRDSVPAGAYTVRVVTIDPGKYTVYDIAAVPLGTRWQVVRNTVLFQAFS